MTIRFIISACFLLTTSLIPSCAYMQTHKNIEESRRIHTGYELTSALKLYRAGENYYIAANKYTLRKHYPIIHDSIFLNHNNTPTWEKLNNTGESAYFKLSTGTADILQRADGYVSLDVLSDEIRSSEATAVSKLPGGAREYRIKAQINGSDTIWTEHNQSTELSAGTRLLSTADEILIDWPGTLIYNVAIPVMAPFVFFHQFLNED